MATLSQITKETKTVIHWILIIVASLVIIYLGIRIGSVIKEAFFPTPPPPPTVSFGKLSKVSLPESQKAIGINYTIDTVTGKLPSFADRINVFKMEQAKSDLLAFQKAQEKARNIGFLASSTTLSDGVYQWTDSSSIARKFTFNTISNSFNLDSNFYTDEKIMSGKNLPQEDKAIVEATDFLDKLSMLPEDLDESKTKTTLFAIKNYALLPATSLANSQVIRVDFFQKDIDGKKIFYGNATTPNITVYIAGGDRSQVVKADYFYQKALSDFATYPIKTPSQAFEELQKGEAFIAFLPENIKDISITNVTLGYFIPDVTTDYLIPIIVFEGNNGFLAYVSAITDEWISN